jgi:hypothetical protein
MGAASGSQRNTCSLVVGRLNVDVDVCELGLIGRWETTPEGSYLGRLGAIGRSGFTARFGVHGVDVSSSAIFSAGFFPERFAGPAVELVADLVQRGLVMDAEISAFGQVLPQQPVGRCCRAATGNADRRSTPGSRCRW